MTMIPDEPSGFHTVRVMQATVQAVSLATEGPPRVRPLIADDACHLCPREGRAQTSGQAVRGRGGGLHSAVGVESDLPGDRLYPVHPVNPVRSIIFVSILRIMLSST